MTARPTGNRSASVRQRLLNLAKARGEEFQRILTRYALERLLYRLSVSDQKDRFLLKGALLLVVWSPEKHRPTKDLDLMDLEILLVKDELARKFYVEICRLERWSVRTLHDKINKSPHGPYSRAGDARPRAP